MRSAGHSHDRAHMARAIAVASAAHPRSSPNPTVGCVLADGARVIAEAATDVAGGPHAEAAALARAGDEARGATAYVTLEPCAHHGRTPPCANALAEAGIDRVVYAVADPHVLAAGGADALADAGVEVTGGLFAEWVAPQLAGFLTHAALGRPHVTLKLAQGVDGRLETGDPARRWLTGTAARRAVHRWRAAVDGVLVGSQTVLNDDPRLDVRDVPVTRQPRAIVVDGRLRTPPEANVVRPGTVVVTRADADPDDRAALEASGATVVTASTDGHGRLMPAAVLSALAGLGITSILAEPGRTLATAMLAAGTVDRVVLHVATDLGRGPLMGAVDLPGWRLERLGGAGPDVILEYAPPKAAPTRGRAPTATRTTTPTSTHVAQEA